MKKEELQKILTDHQKWLNNEGGQRADLQDANLQDADLQYAILRYAILRYAILRYADLRGANLQDADLQRADLRGADLQDADLDFSCFPLWCGSKNMKVDLRFVYQLLAHVYVLGCKEKEFIEIQKLIKPFAEKSHRWGDLQ